MSQPTGTSDRNNALTINSTALAFSHFRESLALSINGRVSAAKGRGISGAVVSVGGADGVARTAGTNTFGYYSFADLSAGETYVVNIRHKRYQFAPQVVILSEQISGLNFSAAINEINTD